MRFVAFTLFSQPMGKSPAYQNHPFSTTSHSNIANRLYFLAYDTIELMGRSSQRLAEMVVWRPLGGIRENPQLPNNSCLNEIITACQYSCIAVVQIPSLCEPGTVTVVKCLHQNSKALCCRNGRTEVGESMIVEKSSGIFWSNLNCLITLSTE